MKLRFVDALVSRYDAATVDDAATAGDAATADDAATVDDERAGRE